MAMVLVIALLLLAGFIVGVRLLFFTSSGQAMTVDEELEQIRGQIEGWMYERAWDSRRTLEEFERRLDDRGY